MSNEYLLFRPITFRGVTLPNRIVLSPMAMYVAEEAALNDFHMTHYGKFAMGGVGLVIVEQTAVCRRGRITNGCLGLWSEEQLPAFRRLTDLVHGFGSKAAIQINHGGRKASAQRAWQGNGALTAEDLARGEELWQPEGPSDLPFAEGWPVPEAMTLDRIGQIRQEFVDTALLSERAGFDIIELHLAHGYLLQSFLTPLANKRTDAYGGSLENRMRLPLEIARDLRAALSDDTPIFARISATDWVEGGWTLEDSVVLAQRLKEVGVDLIDCSSGGNLLRGATNSNLARGPLYQVPFAEEVRRCANVPTMAVGMIRTGAEAESVLRDGRADLVAIGRQMLFNPFWAQHYAQELGQDPGFSRWPEPYGWWLSKWAKALASA
ncbi:NADH:flavin oxidoreductase/NADH oxidase [Pollutimonas bauzanensis]|uniref:2,4-dienoyl-CoA reductase n=1 Tax=Pollutimonas bauzanensis TaxID=658167 RepID=A0A1M5MJZ6_9BURK|nr:NADH:flavin oxidoreductase/NADH oxidase [Pollutimonas bauzanensis]SHG77083.1 2,4-dienoyl-CoA reductase [Pollutimonas bauzanensis]